MNKIRKFEIIECPNCGYEYLPAEIYVPSGFFGKPSNITRNELGKLESYEGTSVDVFEKYICDNCNTEFRVTAKLQLTAEVDYPGSFSEEYTTKL